MLLFVTFQFSLLAQRAYIKDKNNNNIGYFEKNTEGGYNFYGKDGSNMGRTKYDNGNYIKYNKYGEYEYKIATSELDNLYKTNTVNVYIGSPEYITKVATTAKFEIKPMDYTVLDHALAVEAEENDPDINIRKLDSGLTQYKSGDQGYVVWWDFGSNVSLTDIENQAGKLRVIGFTKAKHANIRGRYYVILGKFQSTIEAQEWIKKCKQKLPIGGFDLKVLTL